MPWYKRSFGDDYLIIYPHRDWREARRHVKFAAEVLQLKSGQRVLDLGCGYGRHAVELGRLGMEVYCLDLSPVLLEKAQKTAERLNISMHFICGDMREIPYHFYFDAVLSFFTSFGYFETDEENKQVFVGVREALLKGGLFLLDYFNVNHVLENLVSSDDCVRDGIKIVQERCYNEETHRIEKKVILSENGKCREYFESVRAYTAKEIVELLEHTGFKVIDQFGDYNGSSFRQASPRLITTCKKG